MQFSIPWVQSLALKKKIEKIKNEKCLKNCISDIWDQAEYTFTYRYCYFSGDKVKRIMSW